MPYHKGQSGNPNGRPKVEHSLTDLIRKKLKDQHPSGVTREQFIAERLLEMAESLKDPVALMAIDKILDRLEGKPKQVSEIDLTEHKPITYDPEHADSDDKAK